MSSNIYKSHMQLLVTFAILIILPISISQSEEQNELASKSSGATEVKLSKLKFTWNINNVKYCCQKSGEMIKSPTFSSNDGCEWYMDIRPKDDKEKNLYLFSVNCNTSVSVTMTIVNGKDEKTVIQPFSIELSQGQFFIKYLLPNDSFEKEEEKKLTIICEITAQTRARFSLRNSTPPKRHLMEDFGHLLENQDWTDVTLTAGETEFKSHKAILAARSPVFKTMLVDGNGTSNTTKLEITDVDPKTLSEMLRYIYTEEVLNLEKVAPNLLVAADKFELDGLKTMSENFLISDLSVKNAVDFFILGDKYRAGKLKNEAKKFIIAQASDIVNTIEFRSLVLSEPRLVVEIFELSG